MFAEYLADVLKVQLEISAVRDILAEGRLER